MNASKWGEGLHGWVDDRPLKACLAEAPDAVKAEPFGPYMRCVLGECDCKMERRMTGLFTAADKARAPKFDLTERDLESFQQFTAGMTTGEREAFMSGVRAAHQRFVQQVEKSI